MEPIARRDIRVIDPTGESAEGVMQIFAPYTSDDGENYMCRVEIIAGFNKAQELGGVDSVQALALACRWLSIEHEQLVREGYQFFWLGGEEPMESIDYFPKELLGENGIL